MHIRNLIGSESLNIRNFKGLRLKVVNNLSNKRVEEYSDKNFIHFTKIYCYFTIFIVCIFLLRLFYLQIIEFQKFHTLSSNNYQRKELIYANRGLILDRNGEILVNNVPNYIISQNISLCYSRTLNNYDKCLQELTKVRELIEFDLDFLVGRYQPDKILIVKKYLSKEEIDQIYLKIGETKSIQISILPARSYKYPESFSHVLGYVSESDKYNGEFEGKSGLEAFYNNVLAGVSGYQMKKVDVFNNTIDSFSEISPVSGKDITLSIDARLQNFTYEKLKEKINKKGIGGAVVIQNPQTGEILGLVNYPSYDLNKISFGLSQKEYQELLSDQRAVFFNRAVSGVYPPGSVFKLITASAILEENVASPTDTIFDPGYIQIGSSRYSNWKLDGHGIVDLTRAIVVSNDTYFYIYSSGYQVPRKLGIEGIHKWALKFNISKPTGIDLSPESPGFMPDGKSRRWFLGDTFITSIGQGDVLSTPLQMSVLTSYFGANQKAYIPYIVKSIDNLDRKPKILYEDLLKKENFDVVKEALRKTNLPGGTAFPFDNFHLKFNFYSGGKTGTSEYMTKNGMSTHAWYSVFAPYDEARISVTIFLEGGGSGAYDAAPLAREIVDYYFSLEKSDLDGKKE